MTGSFEFWVALRYLKIRSRELFISLITWISVGGVALGVATLVVVLSVMNGFETDLREKLMGLKSHVRIEAAAGQLTDWERVLAEVSREPGVVAAAPFVEGQVMLAVQGRVQGIELKGLDAKASRVLSLDRFLVEGSLAALLGDRPGILIGRELARNWGLYAGDLVKIVSPAAAATPAGLAPRFRIFRVAGVFVTGMYDVDSGTVFASLTEARDFLRMDKGVTGVELRLADPDAAGDTARALGARLGAGYLARDWTELNRSLFGALKLERLAMLVILGLIVLVAAFNIASTLTMVVMEKAREIGILMSLGLSSARVRRIFLLEGAIIGVAGTALGVLGGTLLAFLLKKYKFLRLPQDVYYIESLPVVVDPVLVGLVAACAVGICVLATFYPSWQAARLDPVETIRYE